MIKILLATSSTLAKGDWGTGDLPFDNLFLFKLIL